jgi:hypothetical protein
MCGYMFEDYPTNKSTFWEGTAKTLRISRLNLKIKMTTGILTFNNAFIGYTFFNHCS